jgi:hypothetical protein
VIELTEDYTFFTHLADAFNNPIKEQALTLVLEIEG